MFANLGYERRLQALERFMREIRGDRGATAVATWTPAWTNLTVVGSLTTNQGTYVRIGPIAYVHITLQASPTSTASTLGSTYCDLPFVPAKFSNILVMDATIITLIPNGEVYGGGLARLYTPTWAASADQFDIDASFLI